MSLAVLSSSRGFGLHELSCGFAGLLVVRSIGTVFDLSGCCRSSCVFIGLERSEEFAFVNI